MVARQAHNLKVVGSIPSSATNEGRSLRLFFRYYLIKKQQTIWPVVFCICISNYLTAAAFFSLRRAIASWMSYARGVATQSEE